MAMTIFDSDKKTWGVFNETLCLYMFSGSRLETQPLLLQRTRFYTRYIYAYIKKKVECSQRSLEVKTIQS